MRDALKTHNLEAEEGVVDSLTFRLRVFVCALLAVLSFGIVGFMAAEDLSLTDAVYFSVVTVATVGYGDLHPITPFGKLLAIILIVTGVGTFLGVIGNATEIMLNRREKINRTRKLNMVIGLFYSEIGVKLIKLIVRSDLDMDLVAKELKVNSDWSDQDFLAVRARFKDYDYSIDMKSIDLEVLRSFLGDHRVLLLRFLENPALLEDESFTALLTATFHLNDELLNRADLSDLPESDEKHLRGDILRVYALLIDHWLTYMKHLKVNYPYLFSLAMRTNPFDTTASAVIA